MIFSVYEENHVAAVQDRYGQEVDHREIDADEPEKKYEFPEVFAGVGVAHTGDRDRAARFFTEICPVTMPLRC